jgi:type II secretory pathway component PulC
VVTAYALSAAPAITVPPQQVTRDVLLEAVKGRILASAELRVTYTRAEQSDVPGPAPARSTLPIRLVGAAVSKRDPSKSVAIVACREAPAPEHTVMLLPGDRACGVAEIREVRAESVVVRNLATGGLESLGFDPNDQPSSTPAAPARTGPPTPTVTPISPTEIAVDLPKQTVEHYLSNLPELLASALATPHYRDTGNGQRAIDGFELSGVQQAGAVDQLGLQNGDIITEFNGEPLDSLAAVMRVLPQVRSMPRGTMTVVRGGQRLTFVIRKQ